MSEYGGASGRCCDVKHATYSNERDLLHGHAQQGRRPLGRWEVQQAHRKEVVVFRDDAVKVSGMLGWAGIVSGRD